MACRLRTRSGQTFAHCGTGLNPEPTDSARSGRTTCKGYVGLIVIYFMIKTFADRRTKNLYETGKAKWFPANVAKRAARKLEYLDLATKLDDLRNPPGNRLHALEENRKGQYAICINDQWCICFRFEEGDAYDVEVCDYH